MAMLDGFVKPMSATSDPDEVAPQDIQVSAASLEDIGIAILIDLATRGEIDPWDVQVIDAIDRYLSQLALGTDAEARHREANLSQSGQGFLWASMLVLLKADTLGQPQTPDGKIEFTDEEEAQNWVQSSLPTHLERYLRRRPVAGPAQKRPISLTELIEQLQQMAAAMKEKLPQPLRKRPKAQSRDQAARLIAQLAHNENLTEIATQLDRFLKDEWLELAQGQEWLDLEQLLELWSRASGSVAGANLHDLTSTPQNHDRVGVFWALLLLSAQSKVELAQQEFYQDIKIRSLCADD